MYSIEYINKAMSLGPRFAAGPDKDVSGESLTRDPDLTQKAQYS